LKHDEQRHIEDGMEHTSPLNFPNGSQTRCGLDERRSNTIELDAFALLPLASRVTVPEILKLTRQLGDIACHIFGKSSRQPVELPAKFPPNLMDTCDDFASKQPREFLDTVQPSPGATAQHKLSILPHQSPKLHR
jgi:hypothetical protein